MRRFGLFGFLVLLLLVGAVGAVSYNLGISTGAAEAALADGAAVIYAPAAGLSPFGLILGFFFVVLIIGFIGKAFAGPRMAMGPGHWGHRGRGAWADGHDHDVPEPFRPMLERWHQAAHAPTAAGMPGTPPGSRPPEPPRPPQPGGGPGPGQAPR